MMNVEHFVQPTIGATEFELHMRVSTLNNVDY